MKIAKNTQGKIVNIAESFEDEEYICPVCKEKLKRNFGVERQYFSHPKGLGDDCELKMKQYENSNLELSEDDIIFLKKNLYNHNFKDINIEMSNYISEEGYPLTKQQVDIINSTEDRIKVEASAGASKSTTLYYYSKERPNKRILYLVYNSAMKKEAEQTFGKLKNVTIKTVHGLAYTYTGKLYKNKLTVNYKPIDVVRDLNLDIISNKNVFELAVRVYHLLTTYMLSEKENIRDIELFTDEKFKKEDKELIYKNAEKLWKLKSNYNNNVGVEHDFYLKQFQLMKKDLSSQYDIVLLDEAQDSNMLTFDLVNNFNIKGVVFVGDRFQMLYKWRGATNVIDLLENAKEYRLTTSFRVSQNIAQISNMLIKDVYGYDFGMTGFNKNNKIVEKIDINKPYTLLSRTNGNLFQEAISALECNKKLYFEGGFQSYRFKDIEDCYYFSEGNPTNNPILNKFKDYFEMQDYAEKNNDLELLSLIKTVNKYGDEIPKLIHRVKTNTKQYKKDADIIFTTIHKSKGQTYGNVKLADDTFDISDYFTKKYILLEKIEKEKEQEAKEEMCVIYVAITRAKGEIQLNDKLKKYLVDRMNMLGTEKPKK